MSGAVEPVFETQALGYSYPGASRPAVSHMDIDIEPGSIYAILGPNGSGKSTLLKLLTGILKPDVGVVRFLGSPIPEWTPRERAKRLGVVPQSEDIRFPMTVRQSVALGRYPYLGPWKAEAAADRTAVHNAMRRARVLDLESRTVDQLSGGELQRVRIARALAQEADVLVLDEPTAALDVRYEMEIMELLSALRNEEGTTVVIVTHSLNLAARYADRLLLLDQGIAVREGDAGHVLDKDVLERAYGWSFSIVPHPGPGSDAGAPQVVALRGEP